MLETSNPNRSVLINKSLIHSKKNLSDSELSEDDFSFDQEDQQPETNNGSILGSVRSNILDLGCHTTTENSGRHPKSHHLSLDMSRGLGHFESKMSDAERGSTRQNSQRLSDQNILPPTIKQIPKRPIMNMKLDFSAILKTHATKTSDCTPINIPEPDLTPINIPTTFSNKDPSPIKSHGSSSRTEGKNYEGKNFHIPPIECDNQPGTLNSFVNQLESGDPVSSYRVTFQNDNVPLNEAYEAVKKENLELERIKEELMERLAIVEKENDDLKYEVQQHQDVNNNLMEELDRTRYHFDQLAQDHERIKLELEEKDNSIRLLYEKYIENKEFKVPSPEELTFERIVGLIEERLKKSHTIIQAEMNKRILDKFDQLRDYYRQKQERLIMTINDLESRLNHQVTDKIAHLQKLANIYQISYQNQLKKYKKLKKFLEERPRSEISHINLSLNQSTNPMSSNVSMDVELSVNQPSDKGKHFDSLLKPSVQSRKSELQDDNLSKLRMENLRLKSSLEGFAKKFENLLRENDELKTETNRNAYALKMRVSELESENSQLLSMLKKSKGNSPAPKDKSVESLLKQHSASKHMRNFTLDDREVDDMAEEEKKELILMNAKLKSYLDKMKKKFDETTKELKVAKDKNALLVKKISAFLHQADIENLVFKNNSQLKNVYSELHAAVKGLSK